MPGKVSDLLDFIQAFIPPTLSLQRFLYILQTVRHLGPLLHRRFLQQPNERLRNTTGWQNDVRNIVEDAINEDELIDEETPLWEDPPPDDWVPTQIAGDLEAGYDLMGWDCESWGAAHVDEAQELPECRLLTAISDSLIHPRPPPLLITRYIHCIFCPQQVLHKANGSEAHSVRLLGRDLQITKAYVVTAYCPRCEARYHPHRITVVPEERCHPTERHQILDCHARYLCLSKTDNLWAHHQIGIIQEVAVGHLHASCSGFVDFINTAFVPDEDIELLTIDQGQKLFTEHFARCPILAYNLENDFRCLADLDPNGLALAVVTHLGCNRGLVPGAWEHKCKLCTHPKRFRDPQDAVGVREFANAERDHDNEFNPVCNTFFKSDTATSLTDVLL